jgi:NDP-sugar pyrophosphorylase family protein
MHTVCLLTAGFGTRMGKYAELTDKSLLPINGKAIISHIINQYQLSTTHFVVALRRLALKSDIL